MDRMEFILKNFSAAFVSSEYFEQFLDKRRRKLRPPEDFTVMVTSRNYDPL